MLQINAMSFVNILNTYFSLNTISLSLSLYWYTLLQTTSNKRKLKALFNMIVWGVKCEKFSKPVKQGIIMHIVNNFENQEMIRNDPFDLQPNILKHNEMKKMIVNTAMTAKSTQI